MWLPRIHRDSGKDLESFLNDSLQSPGITHGFNFLQEDCGAMLTTGLGKARVVGKVLTESQLSGQWETGATQGWMLRTFANPPSQRTLPLSPRSFLLFLTLMSTVFVYLPLPGNQVSLSPPSVPLTKHLPNLLPARPKKKRKKRKRKKKSLLTFLLFNSWTIPPLLPPPLQTILDKQE